MGIFVKSLYKALDHSSTVSFMYSFMWNSCMPTKVLFFLVGKLHRQSIDLGSIKKLQNNSS